MLKSNNCITGQRCRKVKIRLRKRNAIKLVEGKNYFTELIFCNVIFLQKIEAVN